MTAWTSDDVYGDMDDAATAVYSGIGGSQGAPMSGASLNGTHTVEQSGQHVALLALIAVGVLVALNRLGIHAAVAASAG